MDLGFAPRSVGEDVSVAASIRDKKEKTLSNLGDKLRSK